MPSCHVITFINILFPDTLSGEKFGGMLTMAVYLHHNFTLTKHTLKMDIKTILETNCKEKALNLYAFHPFEFLVCNDKAVVFFVDFNRHTHRVFSTKNPVELFQFILIIKNNS